MIFTQPVVRASEGPLPSNVITVIPFSYFCSAREPNRPAKGEAK